MKTTRYLVRFSDGFEFVTHQFNAQSAFIVALAGRVSDGLKFINTANVINEDNGLDDTIYEITITLK